jgi:peroxiredoxin Q/BCP|tara:strand:+ start:624 stop:1157 length:534 start_codon:yes stop_codon:yes gene_type:complete
MRLISLSFLMVLMTMFNLARADVLKIDSVAPEFELQDQTGKSHFLADYQGQWVVLYFYPKDDTPGCTTEACAFRDEYRVLSALNTQILGVSMDSIESHADFSEKYSLPFPLLADIDGHVANQYGALASLGPIKFAKRHTIIISPMGKIKKVYRNVDPALHSEEVIGILRVLKSEADS